MHVLTSWLTRPRPGRGVHLADDTGGWQYREYREIAASACRIAAALHASGVRPGDVVCVLLPTGYDCVSALFGAWAAGATVSPVLPPSFQPEAEYTAHLAAVLDQARPAAVITSERQRPLVARAMAQAGLPGEPWLLREADEELQPRPTRGTALLQFTSGSTGQPRGVRVTWDNLDANLAALRRWTDWRDGDAIASWLPLHHDMGLVGALLLTVSGQGDFWLMRPDQFIRDPGRWLSCFAPGKATHAGAPSFAFAYAARRLGPRRLAALDLSGWRTAVVGAETVDPAALESFARAAEPAGFSRAVFLPAYGLAENTLAACAPPSGTEVTMLRPDWESLRFGAPVGALRTARLGDEARPGAGWLVGHGLPREEDGMGIRILGEQGEELPEGHLGEVAVTGRSVADGYHGGLPGGSTRFVDGELRTGDAGFVLRGQLYVLGRMGESIKLRGRSVYVEDLDVKVAAAAGLARERVAVVGRADAGRPGVVVFVEAAPGPWAEKITALLRGELGPEPSILLVAGRRGLVKRTSSGKPRRRHLWQRLMAGSLTGVTVIAHNDDQAPAAG